MVNINWCIKELEKEFEFCRVFNKLNIKFEAFLSEENSINFNLNEDKIIIHYTNEVNIFRLIFSLSNFNFDRDYELKLINKFKDLSVLIDVARNNVLRVKTFKKLILYLALLGYSSIRLYLEDLYEIPSEPYFGYFRGRYNKEEINEIVTYANSFGIKVIPCIQTLAHLKRLKRWIMYRDLFDIDDILLTDNPKTYNLIEKMIKTAKEYFNTDVINIGMDEAINLGRGRYLDNHPYTNRFEIFKNHLNKVLDIINKYNLKAEIWGDMFFNNKEYAYEDTSNVNTIQNIDENLSLIYWDYNDKPIEEYQKIISMHKTVSKNILVAGGSWKWLGFSPNNMYAINHNKKLMEASIKENISSYILTCWGDNGGETSIFMVLPTLFKVSNYNFEVNDDLLFNKLTDNISIDEFISVDYLNKVSFDYSDYTLNSLNRIYLYNDILLGTYDSLINDIQDKVYLDVYKRLKKSSDNSKFGYLFDSLSKLSRVLSLKTNIAKRIRRAYKENDLTELKKLVNDLKRLKRYLSTFYESFYKMWHYESKDFGFDVCDLRIGGVEKRVEVAINKLNKYLLDKNNIIDELSEDNLDFYGNNKDFYKPNDIVDPYYSKMSTVNVND